MNFKTSFGLELGFHTSVCEVSLGSSEENNFYFLHIVLNVTNGSHRHKMFEFYERVSYNDYDDYSALNHLRDLFISYLSMYSRTFSESFIKTFAKRILLELLLLEAMM
ncbi:MAG: hypothetical protein ACRC92_08020 [Peptostreptococcaceae bacterium]